MTHPASPDLDLRELLRMRRAAMHRAVDEQIDQLAQDLRVPASAGRDGTSDLKVLLEYVPAGPRETLPGFYEARAGRTVEVLAPKADGKVFFELVDRVGQISMRSLDETLFHQLFDACGARSLSEPQSVRYGLHPVSRRPLRYNADGSVTPGRFDEEDRFVETG